MNKISKNLRDAINYYFKMKYHDGTGFFAPGTKTQACEGVLKIARQEGIGCDIVPGTIFLYYNDESIRVVERRNKNTGFLVTKEMATKYDGYYNAYRKLRSIKVPKV